MTTSQPSTPIRQAHSPRPLVATKNLLDTGQSCTPFSQQQMDYLVHRACLRDSCTVTLRIKGNAETRFHPEASLVFPNLYISDQYTATSPQVLHDLGITHILSVKSTHFQFGSRFTSLCVTLKDSGNEDLLRVLPTTTQFIQNSLASKIDARVLVHCALGRSRSPSAVIGYLIACHFMTYDDALRTVQSQRPLAKPNRGFEKQLKQWEMQVKSSREEALKEKLYTAQIPVSHSPTSVAAQI